MLDELMGRDRPLVLLDNTELLFDPTLRQDPLALAATRIAQPDDRRGVERHGRRRLPELRRTRPPGVPALPAKTELVIVLPEPHIVNGAQYPR